VHPLDNRRGKNERVTTGQWAPNIRVRNGCGEHQTVIQAASHNYAGFYGMPAGIENLHKLALEDFPVAAPRFVPHLQNAMHDGLAKFFSADFCYTTGTGYGSNILAATALLDKTWLMVFDDKSHNSMHVAAFMSRAGSVKKFPHGQYETLDSILAEHRKDYPNVLVAIEGFYRYVRFHSRQCRYSPLTLFKHGRYCPLPRRPSSAEEEARLHLTC
jgi:serine palmitoyltransferase